MLKKFHPACCFTILIAGGLLLHGCVPSRQFDELKARQKECDSTTARLKTENEQLTTKNNEFSSRYEEAMKNNSRLEKDTADGGNSYRRLNQLYNDLTKSYDKLIANNDKLLQGNSEETKKVIAQLNSTQEELQRKEDALKKLDRELSAKEKSLDEMGRELQQRENKVQELKMILMRKDSTVNALKNTVAGALLGFQDKGLTVTQKNGKVYVSLEERLLFATGSTVVDPKGQEALKQLARVLEKNPDINILIEGHTDDVPMKGSGEIKDNWDLSVIRATSIVKILTSGTSIDPKRLTAAGRGEYLPLDHAKTAEARKKNRRTEIILSPRLDELLKVLETN